jgi:hypothetical protein
MDVGKFKLRFQCNVLEFKMSLSELLILVRFQILTWLSSGMLRRVVS